jgi:adenine-specific DNA methylase
MTRRDGRTDDRGVSRLSLPIERGFPIERINEIAQKEGRAKRHYRPIYTMHKWWARRLGCVFRSLCLYSLLDAETEVDATEPGEETTKLSDFGLGTDDLETWVETVEATDPSSFWNLYRKDVTVEDKRVLDPFMGGGTSLVEASRFGAEVVGNDLNPVAWFVTKKEMEAGQTDVETLDAAFEEVRDEVADELASYYRTPCPNADRDDSDGGDADRHLADVMHYLWVKELECVSCGHSVPLFSDYRVGKGRYDHAEEYTVYCPSCEELTYVEDWRSESTCDRCRHEFVPEDGTVSHGEYSCPDCGRTHGVTDAIEAGGEYDRKLYAVEYYCPECDERGRDNAETKGYVAPSESDRERYAAAAAEWDESPELRAYVPDEEIPDGAITASSSISGNDVFRHGYETWTDMFNDRQLLALSKLLRAIDGVADGNAREYLLLAFSDMLRFNNTMVGYQSSRNHVNDIFQTNSFAPKPRPAEANVWGTDYGMGSFRKNWELVRKGVAYANAPTERYVEEGQSVETDPFETPVGGDFELHRGDMRTLGFEDEFDAVLTDPPYYDNIIYSEVADYFYVWQKLLLDGEYDGFDRDVTPRAESIVTNPFLDKTSEDFESELHEAFTVIRRALTDDGVLAFTYHHSDSESWGELLEALCEARFEVTATYPISADVQKFITGDAVSFDTVVVARPVEERAGTAISWRELRGRIRRAAVETRRELADDRDLSRGDIGVVEMGECFREYSRYHGEVRRDGDVLDAKEVVDEIYGIVQETDGEGVAEVFVALLEASDPTLDAVKKRCHGTDADPADLRERRLVSPDDEFGLGTWDDEERRGYLRDRARGDRPLTALGKLQFLRDRYEEGEAVQHYVDEWETDDLRALAARLADATGDETYRRLLGNRDISSF